jgi:hypothetical protein
MKEYGLTGYIFALVFCKDSIHLNDSKTFWKDKVVSLCAMKEYGGLNIYLNSFFWKNYIHVNDSKAFGKVMFSLCVP